MDMAATTKELVFLGTIALIGLVTLWDYRNRRRRQRAAEPAADAPETEPYKVYTRDYDLILPAEDVPKHLPDASDDAFPGLVRSTSRFCATRASVRNSPAIVARSGPNAGASPANR